MKDKYLPKDAAKLLIKLDDLKNLKNRYVKNLLDLEERKYKSAAFKKMLAQDKIYDAITAELVRLVEDLVEVKAAAQCTLAEQAILLKVIKATKEV